MNGQDIIKLQETDHGFDIIEASSSEKAGEIRIDNGMISFSVLPEYRGRHYAAEAVSLAAHYLHKEGIKEISAVITEDNDRAKHVLEHCGFEIRDKKGGKILYAHAQQKTARDDDYDPEGMKVICFAGGCFWGTERVFRILDGVTDTKCGYANGRTENPVYEDVCRRDTGYAETVRVTYDPSLITLEKLLQAFFLCIHPEQKDGQGNDTGDQYRTGIYYRDEEDLPVINAFVFKERKKHTAFYTEVRPLEVFYEAE